MNRRIYSRTHANRGAVLEKLIDMTNRQYRNKGIADIRKIPTPIKILSNNKGRVTGHTMRGELVDYLGIHDSRAIAFDAKETSNRTNFVLSNVPDHQYNFLKSWHEKGAHSFLIVSFKKHDEVYLLPFKMLETYWEGARNGGRKSIPYGEFVVGCERVVSDKGYALHYLSKMG